MTSFMSTIAPGRLDSWDRSSNRLVSSTRRVTCPCTTLRADPASAHEHPLVHEFLDGTTHRRAREPEPFNECDLVL
jgi:hypothetical protein